MTEKVLNTLKGNQHKPDITRGKTVPVDGKHWGKLWRHKNSFFTRMGANTCSGEELLLLIHCCETCLPEQTERRMVADRSWLAVVRMEAGERYP